MKPIPWRVQLGVAAVCYGAVLLVAVVLIHVRYMQYVNHPAISSGGMDAFSGWMLALFIGGLFLIPTFLLVLVIRRSETAYRKYSRILLGLALPRQFAWECFSAVCLATP